MIGLILYTTDQFVLPLPEGHRFPMERYRLLRERLQRCGLFPGEAFQRPPAATDDQLATVHTSDWIDRVVGGRLTPEEQRRIGFPWTEAMVERSRRSTGATIAAAATALRDGIGVNLAGGTHHAFADRGAAYCVFNDVAVSARCLLRSGSIRRALVLDLDVHQGDGTAALFSDEPAVCTLSVHARKAFPVRKQQSDWDLALAPGTQDAEYLQAVNAALQFAKEQLPADLLYFVAGADPFERDLLGGLSVSREGLAERDRLVFEFCLEQKVPVTIVMAGGYAPDVTDIVDIQFTTIVSGRHLQSQ